MRPTLLSLAGLILGTVCDAGPLPGFVLASQTERISFYTRGDERVDARRVEQYLAAVERQLGYRVSSRIEYYRHSHAEEIASVTGAYGSGVTLPRRGQIHSTLAYHPHEIVHIVAAQAGNPGLFFQEGLAVALGDQGKLNGRPVDEVARRWQGRAKLTELVDAFAGLPSDSGYALAGSFMGYLIRHYDLRKVSEFFRACSGMNTAEAFALVFGARLDDVGGEWVASLARG